MKLSVIVPGRREPFMQKTIDSFLSTSTLGWDVEVIAVLDGNFMEPPRQQARVKVVQIEAGGMRAAINAGLSVASGEYVMKVDAHCCFAPGFDEAMISSCADHWLMIPRRYSLDDGSWTAMRHKPSKDYHFLSYPTESRYGVAMTPAVWQHTGSLADIDDTMTFQGSCWLANRRVFMQKVGLLNDSPDTYGTFAAEQLEVGLKYWLSGGEVKVNKKTWYAHLWKMPRHYSSGVFDKKSHNGNRAGWSWSAKHWINNEESGMKYPFSWLVEKFWPVPTWPEDRNLWRL